MNVNVIGMDSVDGSGTHVKLVGDPLHETNSDQILTFERNLPKVDLT